jgi:uncharacterized flavoprotein (TIGR03862 family)
MPSIIVIGGGPAGLMAAETLLAGGARVVLYESMPAVGRKLLVAGHGGLNLTHAGSREQFLSHYSAPELRPMLEAFGQDELRAWAAGLGIETFTGSSDRVFPTGMKAAPLWHAWRKRLDSAGLELHTRHEWQGWGSEGELRFATPEGPVSAHADALILALGGGSWPRTGSTGAWVPILRARGVDVAPLRPANCGFDVAWSDHFRAKFAGAPLKTVTLSFEDQFHQQGEFVVTKHGIEGSLVYAAASLLRDAIEAGGQAVIHLDLLPDWTVERLAERLSRPRGSRSLSSQLEKAAGIKGVKAGLLWEFIPRADFDDPQRLAAAIKRVPVALVAPRPLVEAISSAGGVRFGELDPHLMLRSLPGVFCAGEMLDWEAPTGGYLLTGCLATGRAAALGALEWLKRV